MPKRPAGWEIIPGRGPGSDGSALPDQSGDEAQAYGVFAVQKYDKIGAELYLGARNHELERSGANFDDVLAVLVGGRVKF